MNVRRPGLRPPTSVLFAAALLLFTAAPARADLTAFIGATPTPVTRPAKGFAVGTGLMIVGFEFEFASINEDLAAPATAAQLAPALKTYMFNGLLQTPFPLMRMQFYGTVGGGLFHETYSPDATLTATNFATNIGGGAKITIVGPLRLRLDYRVFTLHDVNTPFTSAAGAGTPSTLQRFYAGVNLKF